MNKNLAALLILTLSIFIIVIIVLNPFPDKSHGYFMRIPDMNVARVGHKSFLMSDGKVLIVGGDSQYINMGKYLTLDRSKGNSVEIYDPATNSFALKKELGENIPEGSSIVLLKNDKLLITGGELRSTRKTTITLNSAQIYDPTTETITKLPNMKTARESHSSVLLKDGRVLIWGGNFMLHKNHTFNKTAEIYDPKLNKFILLKSSPYFQHAKYANMCILNNGEIFIANSFFKKEEKIEIFNPRTETFKILNVDIFQDPKIKNIHFDPRDYHLENIILLKNDRIVLFWSYKDFFNNISIFDVKTKKLQNVGSMNIKERHHYEVTLLNNDNILITNGYKGEGDLTWPIYINEIFDTKELKFYKLPKVDIKRIFASTILLKDGKVLITGGQYEPNEYLKSAMIYQY